MYYNVMYCCVFQKTKTQKNPGKRVRRHQPLVKGKRMVIINVYNVWHCGASLQHQQWTISIKIIIYTIRKPFKIACESSQSCKNLLFDLTTMLLNEQCEALQNQPKVTLLQVSYRPMKAFCLVPPCFGYAYCKLVAIQTVAIKK